jgi:hypothetical protein
MMTVHWQRWLKLSTPGLGKRGKQKPTNRFAARAARMDCALCCAGGFTSLRVGDGLFVVAVAVFLHSAGAG